MMFRENVVIFCVIPPYSVIFQNIPWYSAIFRDIPPYSVIFRHSGFSQRPSKISYLEEKQQKYNSGENHSTLLFHSKLQNHSKPTRILVKSMLVYSVQRWARDFEMAGKACMSTWLILYSFISLNVYLY